MTPDPTPSSPGARRSSFDLTDPLPTGLLALEASAGTGKTYALCALATRFVAEHGVRASELCVVSFTEAATAELRGRIRARLVEACHHLEAGEHAPAGDDVLTTINPPTLGAAERLSRLARLRAAVAELDEATIATIHGFCSRVLASAETSDAPISVDDGATDVEEVVNDLFLARFGTSVDTTIQPGRVLAAVQARLRMPQARLVCPDPSGTDDRLRRIADAGEAIPLVDDAVDEVRRRRRTARRRSFDDLLADTRDLLAGPEGAGAVAALRQRYRVVLIDEFQDTDHVQWEVFRRAFVDDGAPTPVVVLVGDPKQSIYRFRAADLAAYLDARHRAGRVADLPTNYRSDAPLLRGLEQLFPAVDFGDPEIQFHPVGHHADHDTMALEGAGPASLEIRCVDVPPDADKVKAPDARRSLRADLVDVVEHLLNTGATITVRRGDESSTRPLRARDLAVLVRSNRDANQTALDLAARGIAAATSSATSVLDTEAARQWHLLLAALERPGAPGLARAAAFSWFMARDAQWLAAATDDDLAALHDQLRTWSSTLASGGVPRLLHLAQEAGLHEHLLARPGGERQLTDLEHIAELLQRSTGGRPTGASGLLAVLAELGTSATDEASRDVLSRRIDRDDDAVQVLTVHRSKGLEFPVVLCPYAWVGTANRSGIPHADADGHGRLLDATWITDAKGGNKHLQAADTTERQGEAARLLYVALTRARHRCVIWWAHTGDKPPKNPLAQALGAATSSGETPRRSTDLQPLVERAAGTIAVAATGSSPRVAASEAAATSPLPLEVAEARRDVDRSWRIWSFTALASTAADHAPHAPVVAVDATARPETGAHDEVDAEMPVDSGHDLPAGARFGTLVHEILERSDFAHPDLLAHLTERCAEHLRYQHFELEPPRLAAFLHDALTATLGGPEGHRRLADLGPEHRLDELSFHFPLGRLGAQQLGAVLADTLPSDDPLLPWARGVASSRGFRIDMSGLLHGSIDLVTRTADATAGEHPWRYWVADYKTNRLPPGSSYDRVALTHAMAHAHYPLQAVIYLVALHRYLRHRLPGYEPERHLAGAAYLFVRGMRPDATPDTFGHAPGVFWWQPPTAALLAVDEVLGP